MPELSRFFGIVIRMYPEVDVQHNKSHFHAYYGSDVAVYSLDPIEILVGSIPKRQQRLIEAWAELHQTELEASWQRLQAGLPSQRIEPLS